MKQSNIALKSLVKVFSELSKWILKFHIRITLGDISLRVDKTVESSEIKIFDGLGGLYRTAKIVGGGP